MGNLVFSLGTVEQEPPPAQDGATRYWTQLGGITYFSPINPLINQVLAAWPAQADEVLNAISRQKRVAEDFLRLLANAVDAACPLNEPDDGPGEVEVDDDGAVLKVLALAEDIGRKQNP